METTVVSVVDKIKVTLWCIIMAVLESAIFWIIVAAASEIIALSPLKDNSIIQLVLHAVESLKPGKKI